MHKLVLGLGAMVAAMAINPVTAATLTGYSVEGVYKFPDLATDYPFATFAPATFVAGAGVDTTLNVEDVTFIDFDFGGASLNMSFDTVLTSPLWTNTAFNGPVFTGAAIGRITGVSLVSTNLVGFDASRVSVAGNELRINWAGLQYNSDTEISLAFGMVPEPATWAMMISGFGLVGFAARRRRAALAA
ncbi:MAG: PEPxxWA-CTERM sorting domain-containing protein [Sphingomonadaceae bacterium]